jgi:hypothetical protein
MKRHTGIRHSRTGGNPAEGKSREADKIFGPLRGMLSINWIPACAGMTGQGVI